MTTFQIVNRKQPTVVLGTYEATDGTDALRQFAHAVRRQMAMSHDFGLERDGSSVMYYGSDVYESVAVQA